MNHYLNALKLYATFTGRSTPAEFWMFFLINILIGLTLAVIDPFGTIFLNGLYQLAVFIPSLAIGARRLDDTNRSGWLQLIVLIPIIGFIILIVFWCQRSGPDNRYGPAPYPEANDPALAS